jgi:acetyl-CoA C-acetyltransferase/acetyl-CoA acyltransferase
MERPRVAILDGLRTPLCKSGGALQAVPADDLGAIVVKELLARTGIDPAEVSELVFGNVAQPPHAANIARVIALKAGLPQSLVCHTVHHNCASGIQSLTTAATDIQMGHADLVIAGGTESMSQIPLLVGPKMTAFFIKLMRARSIGPKLMTLASFRPSWLKPVVALQQGMTDPICGLNMGETAEVLAREFSISRTAQDAYSLTSHEKANTAVDSGRFAEEIVGVIGPPSWDHAQTADDGPRPDQSMEALTKLRPYFDRDAGTVTAGNSCPLTDGAAALVLASEAKAKELGIEPLGFVGDWAYAALDGRRMGLGPVHATARLLSQSGRKMSDFEIIELNEAFAAQVIANTRAFASDAYARDHLDLPQAVGEIDPARLNVNGGAIALGHPVGATGTRLVLTVLRELKRRGQRQGLATLCVGGGQGAAVTVEAA